MGNTASHSHQPLERGYARDAFGDIKNTVCLIYFSFVCVIKIVLFSSLLSLLFIYICWRQLLFYIVYCHFNFNELKTHNARPRDFSIFSMTRILDSEVKSLARYNNILAVTMLINSEE